MGLRVCGATVWIHISATSSFFTKVGYKTPAIESRAPATPGGRTHVALEHNGHRWTPISGIFSGMAYQLARCRSPAWDRGSVDAGPLSLPVHRRANQIII